MQIRRSDNYRGIQEKNLRGHSLRYSDVEQLNQQAEGMSLYLLKKSPGLGQSELKGSRPHKMTRDVPRSVDEIQNNQE